MDKFHPNEINNPVLMDGKADDIMIRRTAIKLSEGPRIMVAIPIGGKQTSSVLTCPECKTEDGKSVNYQVQEGFRPEGLVPVALMMSQMNWLPPLNVTMGYMHKTGMLSGEARQIMTQEALRHSTVKYIFYVDDDMLIPPMGLYTLYNFMETHPEAGLVSGIYTTRNNPAEPLVYTGHGEGAAWDIEMGPNAHPTEIMGAGAGCLLARTEAIRDWQSENPDTPIWCDSSEFPASNGGRVTWGHDVRFVRNLKEAGWKTYADGRVLCGHYDIATKTVFSVPYNAPGLKKRAVNTDTYWDAVYSAEGLASWRTYEQMYSKIELEVPRGAKVFELGCGPGILGQRLTARRAVEWQGIDLSEVAVAQAHARYLHAWHNDVRDLDPESFTWADVLVSTEMLEHLSWSDCKVLMDKINAGSIKTLIFGTPFNTMPPSEVPEHEVFVDQEYVDVVKATLSNYKLASFDVVDDAGHAVWVFTRKVRRARKKKK